MDFGLNNYTTDFEQNRKMTLNVYSHKVAFVSSKKKLMSFCSKLFMSPVSAEQGNNYFIKYVKTPIMECVVNFAYTFMCDINEANLCELLSTAEYFCYTSLVDRCAEYIASILNLKNCISLMLMTRFLFDSFKNWMFHEHRTAFQSTISKNCFRFFQFSRKCLYKHDIQRKTRTFVLRNFVDVTKLNTDIMELPCDELVDLLMDDGLNSKSEEPIWEFCLRWIEFDERNRKQYVPRLLENIRLGLLKRDVRHIIIGFKWNSFNQSSFAVLRTAGVEPQLCANKSRGETNYNCGAKIRVRFGWNRLAQWTWNGHLFACATTAGWRTICNWRLVRWICLCIIWNLWCSSRSMDWV